MGLYAWRGDEYVGQLGQHILFISAEACRKDGFHATTTTGCDNAGRTAAAAEDRLWRQCTTTSLSTVKMHGTQHVAPPEASDSVITQINSDCG